MIPRRRRQRLLLPPAIASLSRRLALTRLTLAWGRGVRRDLLDLGPDDAVLIPASAADAAELAADLARLIDDMEIAGVGWGAIDKLAPDDHARYFQITLDFLKIAAEHWPAFVEAVRLVRGKAAGWPAELDLVRAGTSRTSTASTRMQ